MLKDSIAEITNIAKTIQENTSESVKLLLSDVVAQEYAKIMAEGFDNETDEEETTEIEDNEAEDTEVDTEDEVTDDESIEGEESELEVGDGEDEPLETEEDSTPEDVDYDWSDFDDYKVDDENGQYDFTQADDDTVVKVYKLLNNSDEVEVNVNHETNKLELKDTQAGTEYLIDLDTTCNGSCSMDDDDDAYGNDEMIDNSIKESKMIEIVLNEDTNLGYTTNYQSSDVMTTPSMEEPGKNVNDWDAGVPKSKAKPWAGKNTAKKGKPFTEEDEMGGDEAIEECGNIPTKKVEKWGVKGLKEEDGMEDQPIEEEEDLEEANLSQSRWNDTHAAHKRVPAANKDSFRRGGMQKTSKGATYRPNGGSMDESIVKRHKKIVAENKAIKEKLLEMQEIVKQAAVTNMNLGQIVRLLSENSTTQEEKHEIVARFGKEANTINESKELYKKISAELQKKTVMDINEDKQFTTSDSKKINENHIYQSKDLMASLDLMRKICR